MATTTCYYCVAWHHKEHNNGSTAVGFPMTSKHNRVPDFCTNKHCQREQKTRLSFGVENSRALVVETSDGSRGPVTPFYLPPFCVTNGTLTLGAQQQVSTGNKSYQISQGKHEGPGHHSEKTPTAQRSSSDAIRCSVIANLKQPNTDHQAVAASSTE
jgi:hypothetical protein